MALEAVLNSEIGLIVAPAGCGKTHLITEALNINIGKPYLVLTHTTAGVAALKQRLKRLGVSNRNFVVATIDGWALHIAKMFPKSCDLIATPDNPRVFYPELRRKVNNYVGSGHIAEIISSSYSRLLVDEYQDCDAQQHTLICSLSEILPTIVFGDQMQCIFNFGGPMPSWDVDVKAKFPVIGELNTPWRWINSGAPVLGQWILGCRDLLLQGLTINLLSCPGYVNWTPLSGNAQTDIQNQNQAQYRIRNENNQNDSLLVIGDSRNPRSRHNFASLSRGLDVVEPVDLADITSIATQIDNLDGRELADHIITSVSSMMTGLNKAKLKRRMTSIIAGRNRTPATEIELAIKSVIESGSRDSISNLCNVFESSPDTRIFILRPSISD